MYAHKLVCAHMYVHTCELPQVGTHSLSTHQDWVLREIQVFEGLTLFL